MTNAIAEIIRQGVDAASTDWRVSAGMIAVGVLIGVGKVWKDKRKHKNSGH